MLLQFNGLTLTSGPFNINDIINILSVLIPLIFKEQPENVEKLFFTTLSLICNTNKAEKKYCGQMLCHL